MAQISGEGSESRRRGSRGSRCSRGSRWRPAAAEAGADAAAFPPAVADVEDGRVHRARGEVGLEDHVVVGRLEHAERPAVGDRRPNVVALEAAHFPLVRFLAALGGRALESAVSQPVLAQETAAVVGVAAAAALSRVTSR